MLAIFLHIFAISNENNENNAISNENNQKLIFLEGKDMCVRYFFGSWCTLSIQLINDCWLT